MKPIATLCLLLFFVCPARASAPDLLLASLYHDGIRVEDYWISEKLDGVRAYWDGQQLLSRNGYRIHAPAWFTRGLPPQPLDGELWMARGAFDQVSAAVRRFPANDDEWRQIGYYVFELPAGEGTFTERLAQLDTLRVVYPGQYWHRLEQFRLADAVALMKKLDAISEAGGEGLMLHHQDAAYQTGRSDALLKLKRFQDDEAVVVGYSEGKGKYLGQVGALVVETPDKRRFRIGSGLTDAMRDNPPPIGSVITYKYYGLTHKGMPRFASFLRLRDDW